MRTHGRRVPRPVDLVDNLRDKPAFDLAIAHMRGSLTTAKPFFNNLSGYRDFGSVIVDSSHLSNYLITLIEQRA